MSLRNYLDQLTESQRLACIAAPVSKTHEMAGVLKKLEPKPVLFENVIESRFRAVGNLFCNKVTFAAYLGIPVSEIIPTLLRAIDLATHGAPCPVLENAPCQEVIMTDTDLDSLPILRHFPGDGGNFITSGVVIARHPRYGQNADFHRCMQFSKTEMAMRVVSGRHFDAYLKDLKQVDVAICIGCPPTVLAAAAISVEIGADELLIANAFQPLVLTQATSVDLLIPAECEFVLEGTVYYERRHAEGPFVDLTETQDIVRQEPVLVVKTITHRQDAIWHALLPGGLEHKLLMGMPREPTIFRKVNQVARCLDVSVSPGGCSWLHAIVQIDKQSEEDGFNAIRAAFAGHRSCKHVFVVDGDIDIYDPLSVEWAMATRFQGDQRMLVLEKEPGSSLDPSADPDSKMTTKVGFDLTKPLHSRGKSYEKVAYPEVDLSRLLPGLVEKE